MQNKLKAFDDANKSASNALDLPEIPDSDRAKAYYRRGLAKEGLKDEDEAIRDYEEALNFAPGDPAITKQLSAVKKKAAEQAKKEKAAYVRTFRSRFPLLCTAVLLTTRIPRAKATSSSKHLLCLIEEC